MIVVTCLTVLVHTGVVPMAEPLDKDLVPTVLNSAGVTHIAHIPRKAGIIKLAVKPVHLRDSTQSTVLACTSREGTHSAARSQ